MTAHLRGFFRPEFINRIDEIIVFEPLNDIKVRQIAGLILDNLATRLFGQLELKLSWEDAVLDYLVGSGFDPLYGARPLKRLVTKEVETTLGKQLIAGSIKEKDNVQLTMRDGAITINR